MITIQQLEEVVVDQQQLFQKKLPGISREIKLTRYLKNPQIIVITGVRRSGKSTLLLQFCEQLPDYYYLNFDDERLVGFTVQDFDTLMTVFRKQYRSHTIVLDEIQNVPYWERFVRRLYEEEYKIFLTGSNAKLLSSELATHLTGRYLKIELYPFSFKEFLLFQKIDLARKGSVGRAEMLAQLDQFLNSGGFPEFLKYRDPEIVSRIYEDILYRDLITRFRIREVKAFQQLAQYLFTNVGNEISYNALAKILLFKSPMSVRNYLGFLQESWLIFEVYKYDYSLKKQFVADKKVYVIDQGMRRAVAFTFSQDLGKLLENLVFLELKRRGYEVYYFKGKRECDFLIKEKNKVIHVMQVTASLTAENQDREFAGLEEAMECCHLKHGTIVVYDGQERVIKKKYRTITIQPLWRWLLSRF